MREAIALRQAHPILSRGRPAVLQGDASDPGIRVWRRDHEGQAALVAFNSTDSERLLDHRPAPDTRLRGTFGPHGTPADQEADAQGELSLRLPARGSVWRAEPAGARVYLSSWDYDGGYRPLSTEPQAWGLGDGAAGTGAKVMDDTPVIVLR